MNEFTAGFNLVIGIVTGFMVTLTVLVVIAKIWQFIKRFVFFYKTLSAKKSLKETFKNMDWRVFE